MTDYSIQPAAHEDAKTDTRSAGKWLIAAFAAVGAVLVSGIGLSSIGDLRDGDLVAAILACVAGVGSVIAAIMLIGDVLTPAPVTLKYLADCQKRRNDKKGSKSENHLIKYLEDDPTFLQGIAGNAARNCSLIATCKEYESALTDRYRATAKTWDYAKLGDTESRSAKQAKAQFTAANAKAVTLHDTVRRLERIASAQQTVLKLRGRTVVLALLAGIVAVSIGAFAFVSSAPDAPQSDLRGAVLTGVDLSGANLRAANFGGVTVRRSNFKGTDLEGADLRDSMWLGTICPDGTDSDQNGHSCAGHLKSRNNSATTGAP